MMKTLHHLALLLLALTLSGCAAGGLTAQPRPMPAARSGLAPQFRIFYDALADHGEWTLIEPYGYVFRPAVSYIGWQPFEYGFWVPNDTFGWVWISSEPFGWATYHYGRWMFDRFEGWVWIPGVDWGPAWVDWQVAGDYVGWAPLGTTYTARTTGGDAAWRFVPIAQLGATDLKGRVVTWAQLPESAATPEPIENLAEERGVRFNRGPDFRLVERKAGPLTRVRIAEVATGPGAPTEDDEAKSSTTLSEGARRAAEAAREARRIAEAGAPAPREVPLVRFLRGALGAAAPGPSSRQASPDSTRR